MMTLETFAEEMRNRLQKKMTGQEQVHLEWDWGNNGTRTARIFLKDPASHMEAFRAVRLNSYFDQMEGDPMEEDLERATRILKEAFCQDTQAEACVEELSEGIGNYEFCKDKILPRLVNTQWNRELLKDIPHIPFLDLSVIFCVTAGEMDGIEMSTRVNEKLREAWGVTAQELYHQAFKNAPQKMAARLIKMDEKFMGLTFEEPTDMLDASNPLPTEGERLEEGVLYCLTNRLSSYGAVAIQYPGLLKEYARRCGKNILILPSSVHEVLLIVMGEENRTGELTEMVRSVNQTVVGEDEVLSDHIYLYDREKDEIQIV